MIDYTLNALHDGAGLVLLSFVLLGGLLYRGLPHRDDRRALTLASGFFALTFLALIAGFVLRPAGQTGPDPRLVYACVFVEGLCLLTLVILAFFRALLPALNFHPPKILQDLATAALWAVWALVLLNIAGASLTGLITTSAVLTAVIGFAMQDTLGNVLGGLAIQLDRSVKVGEWIKVGDLNGRVVEIGWRHTAIETRNWETVILPNSQLMKNSFLVLGRRQGQPEQWRRWVWFNIDYRHAPSEVIRVVERELRRAEIPGVAAEPAPNCIMMNFDESFGRYAVRYWLTDLNRDDPTDSQIRVLVYLALQRAGIPLSIPAHAIFMTEESDERKARKAGEAQAKRIAALKAVDLFAGLNAEELAVLAEKVRPAPYSPGTVLTRQGDEAHWLYILVEGKCDVILQSPDGESRPIGTLGPGQFFGEWGLLTGEPRHATVIGRADGYCLRLDKEAFRSTLQQRPELAEQCSKLLAARQSAFQNAAKELDEAARAKLLAQSASDILDKIKGFFGV
ncbi:MAG: hypothetical protein AMXMBFR7_46430 [Planctomycetota bacterium]